MNYPENMTLQATVEGPSNIATEKATLRARFEWPARIALLLAIVISPWLFGGFYFSAKTGIAIAILIGLGSYWFETAISEKKSIVFPYIAIPVGVGVLIVMLQSWGLPSWASESLLGRQVEFFKDFSGKPDQLPSISMNRDASWSQFGLLILALSAVCLGCRYFRTSAHMKLLFAACTINGAAFSFFGIIQAMTMKEPNRIYWVVELLYGGGPFGPYVNRNSAAGYLMICLGCAFGLITMEMTKEKKGPKTLGTKDLPFWRQFKMLTLKFISELDAKKTGCVLAAMLIAVGVIASLSRGGVLAMLVALIVTLIAYGMARKPDFTGFIFLPVVLLVFLAAGWLGVSDQLIERVNKLEDIQGSKVNIRLQHWQDTYPAVSDMGLLGGGAGAYAGVHRPYRTTQEKKVFHHADNSFFEALVELGWPGLTLYLIAWCMFFYYAIFALFRGNSASTISAGAAGLFICVSQAISSAFDFGLYYPANMLLMAVIAGFLAYHAQSLSGRLRKANWLKFQTPKLFVQILLLIFFAGGFVFALDFYKKADIQSDVREFPVSKFDFDFPNLEDTNRMLEKLTPKVQGTKTIEGLNYMAALYEQRCRLQQLEMEVPNLDPNSLSAEDRERVGNIWIRTSYDFIQEQEFYLRRDVSPRQAEAYLENDFIADNLGWAYQYLAKSRELSPLQPFPQAKMGQIEAIVGDPRIAAENFENATAIAPMNSNLRLLSGVHYLQANNAEGAAPHLKQYLKFNRKGFKTVMDIVAGQSGRRIAPMNDKLVFEQIIPDDAEMLFTLATVYFSESSPYRGPALDKAESLLSDIAASDRPKVILNAKVKRAKGDISGAIEQFNQSLVSRPEDYATQLIVAELNYKLGDLESAKAALEYILRMDDNDYRRRRAQSLLKKIEAKLEEANQKKRSNAPN